MRIFLDDQRPFPDPKYGFQCARDYEGCIALIRMFRNDLEFISLDYDLHEEHTGLDVLEYMQEQDIIPAAINIHSSHIFGRERMREFAQRSFPGSRVTMNG